MPHDVCHHVSARKTLEGGLDSANCTGLWVIWYFGQDWVDNFSGMWASVSPLRDLSGNFFDISISSISISISIICFIYIYIWLYIYICVCICIGWCKSWEPFSPEMAIPGVSGPDSYGSLQHEDLIRHCQLQTCWPEPPKEMTLWWKNLLYIDVLIGKSPMN